MDYVLNESCYKETILQNNYRKMTCNCHFLLNNSFVKLHFKFLGSHNMTLLYQNLFCSEACYKGIALYSDLQVFRAESLQKKEEKIGLFTSCEYK